MRVQRRTGALRVSSDSDGNGSFRTRHGRGRTWDANDRAHGAQPVVAQAVTERVNGGAAMPAAHQVLRIEEA